MILTKNSMVKIWVLFALFFLIGSLGIPAMLTQNEPITAGNIIYVGIAYLLGVGTFLLGRYAEGTANWVNLGNKLVMKELRPEDFLFEYETLKKRKDVVTFKPKAEILRLVALAYKTAGQDEKALETVEEMIRVSPPKKQAIALFNKVSLLFETGRIEEAETLFRGIQKQPLSLTAKGLADCILRGDRAVATGDYATAEIFWLQQLSVNKAFQTPLSVVACHAKLGAIYEKNGRLEEALEQYRYCNENGGKTKYRGLCITPVSDVKNA